MSNRDTFILNLMRKKGMSLEEAEAFALDLDIPEVPDGPIARRTQQGRWNAGDTAQVRPGSELVAPRFSVAATGENGLTARQQGALDNGIPLCPNCHEPENDHIPGCLRDPRGGFTDPERRRAVTKGVLPPSA